MPRGKKVEKKNEKQSKSGASSKAKSQAKKVSKAQKKVAPAEGGVKKKRFRPGTVALREIKRYQKTIDHLIPRAPFQRYVRSLVEGVDHEVRF